MAFKTPRKHVNYLLLTINSSRVECMYTINQIHTMNEDTILVVDDDKNNLQVVIHHLESRNKNYQFLSAPNGQVATKVLQKRLPDLIITDWDMPFMNGIELIRWLKAQPQTTDIPVIIVTGVNTDPNNLQVAFEAGAVDYIRKPINHIELYARIDAALGMYKAMRTIKQQRGIIEDQKNRELSTQTIQLTQKNQLLNDIQEKVQAVAYKLRGELKQEMRQIEKLITSNLNMGNEWEVFKLHFENVHPHFFEDLQQRYPSLSLNDQRHCAYLKIGLSNKEIAHIFNISASSVITHHYRIKKKMGFTGDQKLVDVIVQMNE